MALNKRILVFVDWYEPGFKGGGPIRSVVNFAQNMGGAYDVFIFTSDRDLGDNEPYKNVLLNTWTKRENNHVFYASTISLNWKTISREIKAIDPSFIYLNGMYATYFTIYPLLMKRIGKMKAKVILAPRGMLQQGALHFKTFKKKAFLRGLNFLKIPQYIVAHATDEQEKKDIYTYLPGISGVSVLPNFSSPVYPQPTYISKEINTLDLVFISRISPKKNILFLILLLKEMPGFTHIRLTIRGNIEDNEYWRKCTYAIEQLPKNILVNYDGPINNDEVSGLIQQHHIFVLSTLGENFGHAIFEALSAGRPVLISDQTPWRNLSEQYAGWDLPLQEAAFINALKEAAFMDNETFQQWCKGAWQLANDYIAKSDIKNQYLKLFS